MQIQDCKMQGMQIAIILHRKPQCIIASEQIHFKWKLLDGSSGSPKTYYLLSNVSITFILAKISVMLLEMVLRKREFQDIFISQIFTIHRPWTVDNLGFQYAEETNNFYVYYL